MRGWLDAIGRQRHAENVANDHDQRHQQRCKNRVAGDEQRSRNEQDLNNPIPFVTRFAQTGRRALRCRLAGT